MKKFIVDANNKKKYSVEANDAEHAAKLVKTIDNAASQLQTVNALIEDEKAAVEAYNVAIENLHGKIPEESLQAIIAIRDDENRHIENLQAVVNGTVTEKNLEDSMMNDGINECYESLGKAKDAISMIYKNYAKEQDSAYMLEKLNAASSAIAKAIRHYKAWM